MIHKKMIVTFIGLLIVMVTLGNCAAQPVRDEMKQAVDFSLPSIEGKSYQLSEMLKQYDFVLMVFGTTWCSSCKEEIPILKRLQAEQSDKLKILSIYVGTEQDALKQLIREQNITYSVLLDPDAKVSDLYKVNSTPTMFLINRNKTILFQGHHVPDDINKYLQVAYHKVEKSDNIMGTNILVIAYGAEQSKADLAVEEILQELRRLEKLLSFFDSNSEVSKINQSAGNEPVEVSTETAEVIKDALEMNRLTNGLFDITIGSVRQLYDFKSEHPALPQPADIKNQLTNVASVKVKITDNNKVQLAEKGMRIDLGGIAKGYAIELAMRKVQPYQLRGILIQAGGDMKMQGWAGDRLWNVSVKDPSTPNQDILHFSVSNGAISTSGDYERYFEVDNVRYHHIIDPRTGYPSKGCKSVTIFGRNATETDALSTALFIMGPETAKQWLKEHQNWQAVIIDSANQLWMSESLSK